MTDLAERRAAKDRFFREDPHSPLTTEQRRAFQGLAYFAEDPALAIRAVPEIFSEPQVVELETSLGETAVYLRWARVRFAVAGPEVVLTLYREPGSGALFVPFQDALRGDETYGAGRYLEAQELPDGRVLLDFNEAYNPYCAYNDAWSCPLPPAENRLSVPIRAGEKVFPGH
ncbi:MAG: DUF1684 domain-containing protein [Dehalococcoidia bacterium]|nr:DUF1684 domain-containing protein [Dehalococcoidia bacterium]